MKNHERSGRRPELPWRAGIAAVVLAWTAWVGVAGGQEAEPARPQGSPDDFAARRLLRSAEQLLQIPSEEERGLRMLQTVIEQYPDSRFRFDAYLALGRYHVRNGEYPQGIAYLARLRELEPEEEAPPLTGDVRELYLEGLYLTGIAYFESRQYDAAFPVLRRITLDYPNTVWANQAYYYIGMCHFVQRNWSSAIENLELVGTFVDPDAPSAAYVEAAGGGVTQISADRRIAVVPIPTTDTTMWDSAWSRVRKRP